MSDMEYWKGNLLKLKIPKKYDTFEKQANYLIQSGFILDELEIEEEWFYLRNSTAAYLNNTWYGLNKEELDPEAIKDIKGSNGNYEFLVSFYNGGCDLQEALENLLNNR